MAVTAPTRLDLTARDAEGSRSARRLRREGRVPGVIYGGGEEPQLFAVDARILRNTLAHAGAILEVSLDGGGTMPVLVKDVQRHPVRGEALHVDLLRVRMDEAIHTTVTLELVGADVAPGVVQGGVLSQSVVDLNIEALPGDIPDAIQFDVSGLDINETATLGSVPAPRGVTFLDDPETIVATVTPPSSEPVEEEIETETGRVGEPATDDDVAMREAQGDTADEAAQAAEGS
jgi:large subunit ribosomal protein L25